jgi:hypothetical protein
VKNISVIFWPKISIEISLFSPAVDWPYAITEPFTMRLRRAFFAEMIWLRRLQVGYNAGSKLEQPVKALSKALDKFLISIKN